MAECANLFDHERIPTAGERFDILLAHDNLIIERIVSSGCVQPTEYVQAQDEWVVIVQGNATVNVAGTTHDLQPGDYLFLPAGTPHTVKCVSAGALWLAVHLYKQGTNDGKILPGGAVDPRERSAQ